MMVDILFLILTGTAGAVSMVEVEGYLWHKYAQHLGWFGDTVRYRHVLHHEKDYPMHALRPAHMPTYHSSGQWDWYVVAVVTVSVIFTVLPRRYTIALTLGSTCYAVLIVDYFHRTFHTPHHWLHRSHWFRELMAYHGIHHRPPLANFGIVFFFMDKLFYTFRRQESLKTKGTLFPGYPPW